MLRHEELSNEELEAMNAESLEEYMTAFVTWSHNYITRIQKIANKKIKK